MTIISLQQLALFLNKHKLSGNVADYGGTDVIGSHIIKKMLALNKIRIEEGEPGEDININIVGIEKKKFPKYFCLDFDNGIDLRKPIKGRKFDAGICMDLLEHCSNPFVVAENIRNSLKKGALLFVTVPWIWGLHYYPKDYWRFAPQGLEELFSKMKRVSIEMVKDGATGEEIPQIRLVAVFKKK